MIGVRRDLTFLIGMGLSLYVGAAFLLNAFSAPDGFQQFAVEDAECYRAAAEMYSQFGLLWDGEEYRSAIRCRMPVYPLMYLAVEALASTTGISPWAWLFGLHVVAFLVSIVAVYLILRRVLQNRSAAFAGAGLLILAPGVLPYTLALMPEVITLAFCSWSAYFLIDRHKPSRALWSGVLAGLAVLTKPVVLILVLFAAIAVLLRDGIRHPRRFFYFASMVSLFVCVWLARNYAVWQTVTLSPNGGSHTYHYIRPMILARKGIAPTESHPLTQGMDETRVPTSKEEWKTRYGFPWENLAKRHQLLGQLANEDFRNNLPTLAMLTIENQMRLYLGTGTRALDVMMHGVTHETPNLSWLMRSGWWVYQGISGILLLALYAAALRGVFAGRRQAVYRPAIAVCIGAIVVLAMVVGPFSHTRYRYPMMPFMCVLAGLGVTIPVRRRLDQSLPTESHIKIPPETVVETSS